MVHPLGAVSGLVPIPDPGLSASQYKGLKILGGGPSVLVKSPPSCETRNLISPDPAPSEALLLYLSEHVCRLRRWMPPRLCHL